MYSPRNRLVFDLRICNFKHMFVLQIKECFDEGCDPVRSERYAAGRDR